MRRSQPGGPARNLFLIGVSVSALDKLLGSVFGGLAETFFQFDVSGRQDFTSHGVILGGDQVRNEDLE